MIPSLDIRSALSALLKKHFPHAVYFTNNADSQKGYFYVEIAPKKRMVDPTIYERALDITLSLVLPPDARGCIDRTKRAAASLMRCCTTVLRSILRMLCRVRNLS